MDEAVEAHSTFAAVVASANAWGERFRAAVAAEDASKVTASATSFLCELGMSIPDRDENNDAKVLIFSLIAALTESSHGKQTHPLLQSVPSSEKVAGIAQGGLYHELLGGVAAGAVVFLERQGWNPDPAAIFISKALKHHGASRCGVSAVKKWRNEEALLSEPRTESRRFVGLPTLPTADRAEREYRESGRNDPGAWVKRWLGDQMDGLRSLLGVRHSRTFESDDA